MEHMAVELIMPWIEVESLKDLFGLKRQNAGIQCMNETVSLIGLGNMGLPLGMNLLESGYKLRVYNRTIDKAQPLVEKGAQLAQSAAAAINTNGIVITMVADDAALEDITLGQSGVAEKLGLGGIHVSMSTVSPATAEKLAEHHQRNGASYLACPVFGRPDAVAARKIWLCVSGNSDAKNRVKPILDQLGQGVFDFGETAGAANIVKLTGNFMIMSAVEAMAEAFTLAEKNGIDRARIADLFGQTLFNCPIYQNYGRMIAEKKYEPAGFKLTLGLKDITLALQTAQANQMPMPLASLLRDRLLASVAQGRGEIDWTGLAIKASDEAGL
jgi:3-hydroxyisobutyrate dehydrogenase-like beta-hydroxyacid dehydrogenase